MAGRGGARRGDNDLGQCRGPLAEQHPALLAYSSIAHAGYMLIGLAVYLASPTTNRSRRRGGGASVSAGVPVATLGAFCALSCLGRGDRQVDSIDELAGLAWSGGAVRPALAWALAFFMFSLAGLPPLAASGASWRFFGSALMVRNVRDGIPLWFWMLAVIGMLTRTVSAAYYLRVIGTMFFRPSSDAPARLLKRGGPWWRQVLCAILAVGIGLSGWNWFPLADRASPRRCERRQLPQQPLPWPKSARRCRRSAPLAASDTNQGTCKPWPALGPPGHDLHGCLMQPATSLCARRRWPDRVPAITPVCIGSASRPTRCSVGVASTHPTRRWSG